MNTVLRQESVNEIGIVHVNMQDKYLQFGEQTAENAKVFTSRFAGFRPMEYGTLPQFGVVFEMNHNLKTYQRTIYSFLEWLSEIGGLYGALYAIFSVVLKLIQYRAIDYFIVGQLYSRDQVVGDSEPSEKSDDD